VQIKLKKKDGIAPLKKKEDGIANITYF